MFGVTILYFGDMFTYSGRKYVNCTTHILFSTRAQYHIENMSGGASTEFPIWIHTVSDL